MAYTVKAPQDMARTGLVGVYTAAPGVGAANGFSVQNNGNMFLHVKNVAAGGTVTVTVKIPRTVDNKAVTDQTFTVADGAEGFAGPWPIGIYNQGGAIGDLIYVEFSEITGVTMAAINLP